MDEANAHILSLNAVEITFPLDFLVKATSWAHYDKETTLTWDVKEVIGGEKTLNRIQSCRSSKSLNLQIGCLRFSVQNERHVCDIGQPVLHETASQPSTAPKAAGDESGCWEVGEMEKMTQTDKPSNQSTPQLNISGNTLTDARPPGVVRKKKVGRPRKIKVPVTLESDLHSNDNLHQPSGGPVLAEKQDACSEKITTTVVETEQSENDSSSQIERKSDKWVVKSDIGSGSETKTVKSSDISAPVERKRYSLRGVKLNSDIMGAVKGIGNLDKENEDESVDEMSEGSLQLSENDADTDFECNKRADISHKRKKEQSEKGSASKYFKLNADWIPKTERRQRRIGSIECKLCSKKLCDYTGVYDHVTKKHSKRKGVTAYLEELDSLKVEKCRTCGVTFADRKKLMIHEDREHSKSGRVLCNKCDASFKNVHTLKTHIRAMHINSGSVNLCHLCSASFKSSSTLKQHIDQVHLGHKYFQCEICSKKFYNGSQLRRHKRIHNLPESQKHECPTCEKRFVFAHNLKKHIEVVHSTHKESYHCPYCGKGFGQKVGMISHIQLVHFNIFPYTCKECRATFPRALMLIDHMKSHHKILNFQVTDKPAKNGIYHKTSEDMFYCSYCKEAFLHKTRLVEHMHSDHSDAFPFKCETCNQGFLERTFLVVHQMRAHGALNAATEYLQEEGLDKESNSKKHKILQLITTKGGHSNRTVQYGMHDSAGKENTAAEPSVVDMTVVNSNQPTPGDEEDLTQQDVPRSSLLIEVATSGGGTSRYMIETPELLNEGGSWTVAQDIANLLLAAEQSIQELLNEGGSLSVAQDIANLLLAAEKSIQEGNDGSEIGDGTTEISLVIDGTQTVADGTTYTVQTDAEPQPIEECPIAEPEEVEQIETVETELVESGDQEPNSLRVELETEEGEIQVITLPGGDLDLLQLAAMETVNISEENGETVTVVKAASDVDILQEDYELIP